MNHLRGQKSLYLKQHANNPVHWFPWGEDAFKEAQKQNKPLMVSIGYSTCHWCHVMERESFENNQVAEIMNESFICIKVDREEHPEVDKYYMDAMLAISGHGGWPLNVFILPDKKAFFSFTYLSSANFSKLLINIADVWAANPEEILSQAQLVTEHVHKASKLGGGAWDRGATINLNKDSFAQQKQNMDLKLREIMLQNFDPVYGGFTQAPKFPRSHAVSALLRARKTSESAEVEKVDDAIELTLKAMVYGGMWDHLDGGFHRYSTDAQWLVPHFEKMLYDQALLLRTYSEAYLEYKDEFYADVCSDLIKYLHDNHLNSDGSLAAAFDADSEGVEGKFFVWSKEEVLECLTSKNGHSFSEAEAEEFSKLYNITKTPNWEEGNILHLSLDTNWGEVRRSKIIEMKSKLSQQRAKRVWPARDAKAIVAWNGQMLSALAQAAWNLAGHSASSLATDLIAKCLPFINRMIADSGENKLARVYYDGEAHGAALLEDYVALIEAIQNLQMMGILKSDPTVDELLDLVEKKFWNPVENKLCNSAYEPKDERAIPLDLVSSEDGATPSAVSILLGCLARQALRAQDIEKQQKVLGLMESFRQTFEKNPLIMSYMMCELELMGRGVLLKMSDDAQIPAAPRLRLSQMQVVRRVASPSLQATPVIECCDWQSCFYASGECEEFKSAWAKALEKIISRA